MIWGYHYFWKHPNRQREHELRLILILRNTLAWFRDGAGFVTGGEDGYVRVHHLDKDYFSAKRFE